MDSIVYSIMLLGSFLFLYKKREDTEPYFQLKLIGYFILGSFALNFDQVSLPLGFVVYLLFLYPHLNEQVKRRAAVLGVLAFIIVQWIIPFTIDEWQSRPVFIKHEIESVYSMNFLDEFERVREELKLEDNSLELENFKLEYTKEGQIRDLNWQIIGHNGNGYISYHIQYEKEEGRYRAMSSQSDDLFYYESLVGADRFFENLNVLDIQRLTHEKGDFSYYVIQSSGNQLYYPIEGQTPYVISNGDIQLLDDEQLPVGPYISAYAMVKTGEKRDDQGNITEESFEWTEPSDYLFDVNFAEEWE
ncbi:hypothetical protein [Halalkalibacter akibai]|uniref:Uncharacterized protein n=1 Tax=Halalkalibacter akibai (strain ATCC 43226 / DSM 21942 / CIP 109018 / JCM 9157 / 1139) TaxID=1236973 RepID=W4QWC2_HALA3|nr:hypothetical protein [Halalkalibacter akibai]GAE36212.1 hypothetical protein JCM9157_3370 [Halalkalibacter akibai JCM 9157]